jgi:hypothetical protein
MGSFTEKPTRTCGIIQGLTAYVKDTRLPPHLKKNRKMMSHSRVSYC